MTSSFSSTAIKTVLLAAMLAQPLGACQHQPRMQEKDVQRMLEEMKGPDVPSMDATLRENAQQAEQAQNFASASQLYKQLLDNNPDNASDRFHYAENLRRMGKYDEANEAYRELLDDEEMRLDAMEGLGLSQMAEGEFEDAGDVLAEVMEEDGTRWRTINAIGILFTIKQMYPEARQYFVEALVHSPKNVSVLNNLGLMEALAEQYDEAIRNLQEASKQAKGKDALRKRVSLNLALVYAIKGDLAMAEQTARPHLSETELLNNMGYYAHLADDDVMAKSYLNMALTASEKHYEKAWENLETLNKLMKTKPGS